ncbi:MAG: nucleotidyltransferase domain-containing protein [Nanoarchaeota archaeon]|nr:nucleotidyltransferase domain-containing protein [Nanoarchaeota archaeon]
MVRKRTIWSYLEPFLHTQEELHLADISRKLKKPHATTRKYLSYFEKQGILIKKNKGRLNLYKLNSLCPTLTDYLVLAEKEALIRACQKDLLLNELVSLSQKNLNSNNKVLIFGSATENLKGARDIDLLVIGKTKIGPIVKQIGKKIGKEIHLITLKNLKDATPALKEEIRKKHLILQGIEEIIKWLI